MSPAQIVEPATPPRVWPMYRAMVGVGLLCGLLIVGVFQATKPVIDRKKAEALQRAIFQVVPGAASTKTFVLVDDGGFAPLAGEAGGGSLVYAGYAEDGSLAGLAIEAAGMGYQDVIRVLYGYSASEEAIVGIQVLESKETPGLGTRIETDPDFLRNFERLDVTVNGDGTAVENPIESVKSGEKTEPWQVDTITGATISSKAIADILRQSSMYWVPRLRQNLDDFRGIE